MSDAGFMRQLCVYRIEPVNVSADALGDFRTEDAMSKPKNQIRDLYRTRLAGELSKFGRSQSALARHLGINQSAVSRMISGERNIRLEEHSAIEDYLIATDPNPPATGPSKLPDNAEAAYEPLEAYPELLEMVLSRKTRADKDATSKAISELVEVDSDYPMVMTCAAMLEFELTVAVARLVKEGKAEMPGITSWFWDSLVEKVEIVLTNGRVSEGQAARMLAMFAIRDAFAHSRVMLSLRDEAVRALAEQSITYGYTTEAEREHRQPKTDEDRQKWIKAIRLEYLLTATQILHHLIVNDPAKTAAMFLEIGNKASEGEESM